MAHITAKAQQMRDSLQKRVDLIVITKSIQAWIGGSDDLFYIFQWPDKSWDCLLLNY